MCQIVDRKHSWDAAIASIHLASRCDPGDSWRGVPVMRVQYIRLPAEHVGKFKCRAREEHEAIGIIVIAIHVGAIDELVLGNKIDGHITAWQHALENPCWNSTSTHRDDHSAFTEVQ